MHERPLSIKSNTEGSFIKKFLFGIEIIYLSNPPINE